MRKRSLLLYVWVLFSLLHSYAQSSLTFNGTNAYVSLGNDTSLHLKSFTLEAWIKPQGTGVATTTGATGITAVPVITKGRGQADTPATVNMNYFLGIRTDKKLTADFEEAAGLNHPIVSSGTIPDSVWTHVAATYNPATAVWKLYINGVLDNHIDMGSNIIPADVSAQPAAIGSALNTAKVAAGYFKGSIDEVRIWNIVRTDSDIFKNYKGELTSGTGLVARYGFNEGSGSVATNAVSSVTNGTLVNKPLWSAGYNPVSVPPSQGFAISTVSSGWTEAVGLTFNKAGTQMFVWERPGKIWVVENNQKKLLLDISPEVGGYRNIGLLGFALDPHFDTNGYFYLLYTVDRHHLLYYGTSKYSPDSNEYYKATIHRLTRYTATKTSGGYTVDTLSRKILIGATKKTGIPETYAHGPGTLLFGTDGTLLVSAGDGASNYNTPDTGSAKETDYLQALADSIITPQENVGAYRCQMLESYNGKILRIDPVTGNGVPSNPFYDAANPSSVRSKVWALGLRNPFRMTLKPGTGSTNPADGNPGTIYVGDVGYITWEEIDIVNKPGLNFGWPVFEGLTPHPVFSTKKVYNYYAPNPLYGTGGCTQKYFYFKDLIKQATASGTITFTNPCNAAQPMPSTVKTFMHTRPIIDWEHGPTGYSRAGTFNSSGAATVVKMGTSGSPVAGASFGGSCSIGGVFYPYDDFPPGYKNSYLFADYAAKWIRNITTDSSDKPLVVGSVLDSLSSVVMMTVHPTQTGIYYIDFTDKIKKLTFNQPNRPPVAVIAFDKKYGPTPLVVQFTGSGSIDPQGKGLKYAWNFGDSTRDAAANPAHTFTAPTTAPKVYKVRLTVKDTVGATGTDSVMIAVNATPPDITITSPTNNSLYSTTSETTVNLRATVTDKQNADSQLTYQWQKTLHHANHEHPEPVDTAHSTTALISVEGCGELYYNRIILTVTNRLGLSTTKEVRLYPICSQQVINYTLINADSNKDIAPLKDGDTINVAVLTSNLNIRANTAPAKVGSVVLNLSGPENHTEMQSIAPYALFSDNNGDYYNWKPTPGSYFLESFPYDTTKGTGNIGTGLNVHFTVINPTVTTKNNMKNSRGEEMAADLTVAYSPNPFRHEFTLRLGNYGAGKVTVKIYDTNGKTFVQKEVATPQTITLGKELMPGVYILEVGSGNKAGRYKIVKMTP